MFDSLLTKIDDLMFALEAAYRRRRVAKLQRELDLHPNEMKLRRWMLQNEYDQALSRLEQYGEIHGLQLRHDLKIAQDQLTAMYALRRGRQSIGVTAVEGR